MNARSSEERLLRFTYLELDNWRNFGQVRIDLSQRVFLVGPNASGKSNFLDALRFLHDLVDVGGGFQEAVSGRRRGGVSKIRALSARRQSHIRLLVRIGDNAEPRRWEYELEFGQDSRQQPIIRKERVATAECDLVTRPQAEDQEDPARLRQTYLEQVNVNFDYREVVDFLRSVRYLHVVPQLIREPERSVGRKNDPYGGDFLEQIASTSSRQRDARLRRVLSALKVAVPQLVSLEMTRDALGRPHLRGKYEHWRPQGAWQTEEDFSDGTLRLIGLLWALLDGRGPLLLEEPELSLHPAVVRHLPQMFGRTQLKTGRQLLVSTQSRDLLLDEGLGPHEVLLLLPTREGTAVERADSIREIRELLEAQIPLADAVLPRTSPAAAEQLTMFGA